MRNNKDNLTDLLENTNSDDDFPDDLIELNDNQALTDEGDVIDLDFDTYKTKEE